MRFRVDSLDDTMARLAAAGFRSLLAKQYDPTLGFAYLEAPESMGGSVVEILQLP